MDNLNTKRKKSSIFLLALYLLILLVSGLHTHECEQENFVCQDCAEHVKHHGHISQTSIIDIDCVLCKFLQTSYVTPEVLTFSAAPLLVFALTVCMTQDVVRRQATLPSLRAPPVVD